MTPLEIGLLLLWLVSGSYSLYLLRRANRRLGDMEADVVELTMQLEEANRPKPRTRIRDAFE